MAGRRLKIFCTDVLRKQQNYMITFKFRSIKVNVYSQKTLFSVNALRIICK